MNAFFNDRILGQFNRYALPVAIVWGLMNGVGFYLKYDPIERYAADEKSFYDLFRFSAPFGIAASVEGEKNYKSITKQALVSVPYRLKGILQTSSGGFVTIYDGKESSVVALHARYKKDFTLIGIGANHAIFRGHGKNYRLRLGYDDSLEEMQTVTMSITNPESGEGASEWRTIEKSELIAKSRDLNTLEKVIEIVPVANEGFRVNRVASGSLFERFGLQQGDLIRKVNNKKIFTYSDALIMYRELPQMHSICIGITRNNLKKDLIYEIAR